MPQPGEIGSALDALQIEHGVRVLFAAESGSRAWGFASPDSDWDVRFIYVHPRHWYVRVFERRDVIEAMLPGDLDLSGWDIRKALRLFASCNLALNEWLGSPMVYREAPAFSQSLRRLIPEFFQPARAIHHYLGMARATFAEHLAGESVRLKKVFYFFRPILAGRWIEHARSQPPTEFDALVAADWVSDGERAFIADLQRRKVAANEGDRAQLPDAIRAWMSGQIAHLERVGPLLATRHKPDIDQLEQLLIETVEAR